MRGQEFRYRRTVFGAHLDDMTILFNEKPARLFSSRGQQKLIIMLIKMASVKQLKNHSSNITFLIDDFMTDFDKEVMKKIINGALSLQTQLIFTSPTNDGIDTQLLLDKNTHIINLSI
jgi:DNA replication and repair protein RecF